MFWRAVHEEVVHRQIRWTLLYKAVLYTPVLYTPSIYLPCTQHIDLAASPFITSGFRHKLSGLYLGLSRSIIWHEYRVLRLICCQQEYCIYIQGLPASWVLHTLQSNILSSCRIENGTV